MPYIADRAQETTTSISTGSITLLGAVNQFQSFQTALGSGLTTTAYAIVGQTGTEWEVGKGVFNGTTGLTRDVVRSSSNSNALVNFSAGTKNVFITATSEMLDNANIGFVLAQANGWAMP
jgi:hypothetical protein